MVEGGFNQKVWETYTIMVDYFHCSLFLASLY